MAKIQRKRGVRVPLAILSFSAAFITAHSFADTVPTAPPAAPVRMVSDRYFGVNVADPYRYMEDLKDPEVAAWFKTESDYTRSVLDSIPGRAALLVRIKELDESEPASIGLVQRLPGGRIVYTKKLAVEEVSKLYIRDGWNGEEKLLLDPMKFATPGGPHFAISYVAPSFDGRYIAVGVSSGGSEDAVLRVIDTSTGRETGDAIDRTWFGNPSWLPDGHSFVYNRMQKLGARSVPTDRELYSRVYLHVVGTDPDKDRMVFGSGTSGVAVLPADLPFVSTFPGSPYAIGVVNHGVQNEITLYVVPIKSLAGQTPPWKKFCDVQDDVTGFDARGNDLYLQSHKDAPRYKVLHTQLSNPDLAGAEVVLPAGEAVVRNISAALDALYVQELDGGLGRLVRISYGGRPEQVPLPFDGALSVASSDPRIPGALVWLTSWAKARSLYAYDPASKQLSDTKLNPVGPFDNPSDVETVEVKAKSYDGTLVPLSIVYKKGLVLDGSHPTRLVGYGAYGITLDPYFNPMVLAWLERGGVYAVAHVRGGGEYGEDWHLAGRQLTKPNTWKDMIACAQYLINEKYTSSSGLAIEGGSAGGITIGRSITERPDLFAVAIDLVPVSDAVRMEFSPN
jgi:prolyl oligopeptidase